MPNTIYLLPGCSTCERIYATLKPLGAWAVRDIKAEPLTGEEVDELAGLAGSYAALFSRRAVLYRQLGLHEQTLTEADYRHLLLDHYTFLSRPVVRVGDRLFVGSGKKTVERVVRAV